jgi:flagellar hook-length control protein FliK
LDFDGNSSVILKVDAEGKLTAEFISSDKAMESLLKNSIPQLRNKMDNEGIPYKDISYKDQSQKNNRQEDKSYE